MNEDFWLLGKYFIFKVIKFVLKIIAKNVKLTELR